MELGLLFSWGTSAAIVLHLWFTYLCVWFCLYCVSAPPTCLVWFLLYVLSSGIFFSASLLSLQVSLKDSCSVYSCNFVVPMGGDSSGSPYSAILTILIFSPPLLSELSVSFA